MLTASKLRDDFKYLYPDELPFLKQLVADLPAQPVVINIGAGAGTSGLAIMETRDDVILVTIDVTDASSPFGCLEAERDVMQRAGYGTQLGKRWHQIHSDSKQVAASWGLIYAAYMAGEQPFVDMVFVDGDHSVEGAAADINGWLSWVKLGGTIAVHDYGKLDLPPHPAGPHPKHWPGVDAAVDTLLVDHFQLIGRVDSLIAFKVEAI